MTAIEPDAAPAPAAEAAPPNRTILTVAGLASAAAGLVHAAAAGSHASDRTLALLFAATAVAQFGWAAIAAAKPSRPVAYLGAAVNGVFVLAWVLSRTTGLPVVESLKDVESVSLQDATSAGLGAAAVIGALLSTVLLAPSRERLTKVSATPVFAAGALVMALAVPGMAAQHGHGGGDDHHGGGAASGHAHGEGDDHAAGEGHGHDGGAAHDDGPRITSFDDPRLTEEQRTKARGIYDTTVKAMKKYTDTASVEADGFESINDSISGFEHFIHHERRNDGKELDPNAIEAMVFETKPGQPKKLAAAMYILEGDKGMDEAPEIAGSLTTWHLHDDLCWDNSGKKVVGQFREGRCFPTGNYAVTAAMLHVWPEPTECGPFAEADSDSPVDKFLNRNKPTTTTTKPADPCQHEHGGGGHGGGGHGGGGHGDDHGGGTAAPPNGGHGDHKIPAHLDHEPTEDQKADAQALIDRTKRDTAKYEDVNVAKADGYESIGDALTGVEHYIQKDYYADREIMNSKRIESLVYKVLPDGGREFITAMYIMWDGHKDKDIPDIAGNLTMWHNHANLCWRTDDKHKLGGVLIKGECKPGGVFRETPQMLHVWVKENPCGPFAGVDRAQQTGSCTEGH